uniref:Alpha-tectorin n=1 Tax=Latimeria chalumnae TaxID=7897 RepID=H3AIN8_LATCH
TLSPSFPIFGTSYKTLYVNNNGVLSFQTPVLQYTPDAFPLEDPISFIAPFWADVDNRVNGHVYYRTAKSGRTMELANADINRYFPKLNVTTQWVLVATWDKVAYYGTQTSNVNSFQVVLITDGSHSFVLLNYGDITWISVYCASVMVQELRLPCVERRGRAAGFNSGNSTFYFYIPGSRTADIINVGSTSNVNERGRWVFRTDVFMVVGGCQFNGRFLREGDAFWTNDQCKTMCKCTDNALNCDPRPCAPDKACHFTSPFFSCQPRPSYTKTCLVAGGPHYYAFDGTLYRFQGICTYILAQPCENTTALPFYRVEATNENQGNTVVSWANLVRLLVYGEEVTMTRGNKDHVMVNGLLTSIPLSLANGKIQASRSGFSIMVRTAFGLEVSYDGESWVAIVLPAAYHNATCGLCGTPRNNQSDGFLMPNHTLTTSAAAFGQSWRVEDTDALCWDECIGSSCQPCRDEDKGLYLSESFCGIMNVSLFSACAAIIPPEKFIRSCVYGLCTSSGKQADLCQAVSAYAEQCQAMGVTVLWRRPGFCDVSCPAGSHYEVCGTSCPTTCIDTLAPVYCALACRETCSCDTGYVLSSGQCIPVSQCGCTFMGRYYSIGEQVVPDANCSRKCTCLNSTAGMRCDDFGCGPYEECKIQSGARDCYPKDAGLCWAWGGRHYATFDGAAFALEGACNYTLARSCGTHASVGVSWFNVMERWTSSSKMNLWIEAHGHRLKMAAGEPGKIQVNGTRMNLPLMLGSANIKFFQSGMTAMVQTDFGLHVSFDWRQHVMVTVPATYAGSLCGLCGNFNGDPDDDDFATTGKLAPSWNESGSCREISGQKAGCTAEQRRLYESGQVCGALRRDPTSPFRECLSTADPALYFEGCVHDLCKSGGSHEALCRALEAYAVHCERTGNRVANWQNATSCGKQCPEHSHYELCGSSCPPSCADLTAASSCDAPCVGGCQCDDGFASQGERCVPLTQCGCVHQGQHYEAGERFWINRTQLCHCSGAAGGVQCHEPRALVGGPAGGACSASGDPHYTSFDGLRFDFRGTCRYVLSETRPGADLLDDFRVEVKNENLQGLNISVTMEALIYVYGEELHLTRGKLKLNKFQVNLPLSLHEGRLIVYQSGHYITVTTEFGLVVMYNKDHHISVMVSRVYMGQTQGLCGNFNGNKSDDLASANGTLLASPFDFAASWKANRTADCTHGCRDDCPICLLKILFEGRVYCGILTNLDGPFADCHHFVDPGPFSRDCIYDTCLSTDKVNAFCQSVLPYVRACQAAGAILKPWRQTSLCEMTCPQNSHYELCGNPCQGDCAGSTNVSRCVSNCTEGCYCNPGYMRSAGRCVPPQQCGCLHQGQYLKAGELVWRSNCSETCHCSSNKSISCSPAHCPDGLHCSNRNGILGCHPTTATCTAVGSQHHRTFDGAMVRFHATCKYTFVQLCNALSEHWFQVTTERKEGGKQVNIHLRDTDIIIDPGKTVWVDGTQVSLPTNVSSSAFILTNGTFIVVKTTFNVEVRYDGRSTLLVRVGMEHGGQLCGLCGNFNGDLADDKVLPNGEKAQNDTEFGNAWKTLDGPMSCQSDGSGEQERPCTDLSHTEYYCGIITDKLGHFSKCHWVVDPLVYYDACIYDLCHLREENLTSCHAIEPYEEACSTEGIDVSSWRDQAQCYPVDPCLGLECSEDQWCGEKNGFFGCHCYDGNKNKTKPPFGYRLECDVGKISISLSKCLLWAEGFTVANLHLNNASCIGTLSRSRLCFSFGALTRNCGNRTRKNKTKQEEGDLSVPACCISQDSESIQLCWSSPMTTSPPTPDGSTFVSSVVNLTVPSGSGMYQASMALYQDALYLQPYTHLPVVVTLGRALYILIRVQDFSMDHWVVTLRNCWATPEQDPLSGPQWNLITNQCPNRRDGTVQIIEDGTSDQCRFSFKAFTFSRDSDLHYLHCQVHLCNVNTETCRPVSSLKHFIGKCVCVNLYY